MTEPTIHILSTRPLAATLLDQGAAHGIAIHAQSFITTEPVIDETLGHHLQGLSTQPLVAVFTSMNAVKAVARHLGLSSSRPHEESTVDPRPDGPPWQIFCIGAATRQLIRDHFGEDRIAGTADAASALANIIIQWMARMTNDTTAHPREIFFFCGDQRRDELPDQLRQSSIIVNELVVYHTRLTPHKIETIYDGIVFFSPSAVHSFFSVNKVPPATILFAIGATTADSFRTYTHNRTILSASPEKETLIRQVIDYFLTNNIYY
jgi:uroporphyrinogen-III synthase